MYQPNRLLTNPINKYIVELVATWKDYELLLRPARRFLFHNLYRPSAYVPEFNKPCFGVVCLRSDREKRPLLVIETEPQLSEALRQCYRESDVLWLEVYEGPAGIHFSSENGGIRLEMSCAIAQMGTLRCARRWRGWTSALSDAMCRKDG
jgi:hypothetical protein